MWRENATKPGTGIVAQVLFILSHSALNDILQEDICIEAYSFKKYGKGDYLLSPIYTKIDLSPPPHFFCIFYIIMTDTTFFILTDFLSLIYHQLFLFTPHSFYSS